MLVKVIYQRFEIPLKTISIGLASLTSIAWFRTFFLLPVKSVPRELPVDYNLQKENIVSTTLNKKDVIDEQEQDTLKNNVTIEGIDLTTRLGLPVDGVVKSEKGGKKKSILVQFFNQLFTVRYITLCIWYCIGKGIYSVL